MGRFWMDDSAGAYAIRDDGDTADPGRTIATFADEVDATEALARLDRVMGADAARAVGRFKPNGPDGYRAATAPDTPLRQTRAEAVEDERAWLDGYAA